MSTTIYRKNCQLSYIIPVPPTYTLRTILLYGTRLQIVPAKLPSFKSINDTIFHAYLRVLLLANIRFGNNIMLNFMSEIYTVEPR